MKKYLMITPWCPFPPHKNGGVHTIYNIINNLPSDVQMDLFYYGETEKESEDEILKCVKKIMNKNLSVKSNVLRRIRMFVCQQPDLFAWLNVSKMKLNIDYSEYDVVILDQIQSLPFAKEIPSHIPVISMMHDNNILMYERKLERDCRIKKYYDKKQCKFIFDMEKRFFKYIDRVIYVSELDAKFCKEMHREYKGEIASITLGVEIPDILHNTKSVEGKDAIVFSGVMDYAPNIDAAIYFAKEVFPKILQKKPDAKFIIVGKNPTDAVKSLECSNVRVTGFVDNVINEITKARVYVSPLRYGSGTKNKVLEAMAAGMPVFVSSVSREGISGLKDGKNCLFIREENMADVIVKGMDDEKLLDAIASEGKRYVEKNHSWNGVFDKFLFE